MNSFQKGSFDSKRNNSPASNSYLKAISNNHARRNSSNSTLTENILNNVIHSTADNRVLKRKKIVDKKAALYQVLII